MDTTPGRVGGERTGRKERKGENLQTGASVGGRGRGDILGGAETTRRQTTMHRREWREDGEQTGESIQTTTTISQPRTHPRAPTHTHTRSWAIGSKQHRSERVPVSCLQQVHYGLFDMRKPAKQQVQPVRRQRCTLVTFNTRSRVVTVTGQA